jgi:putative endonuclease
MGSGFGTYILYSATGDRHYVGQASGFRERAKQHLEAATQSSKCFDDWMLVFFEQADTLQRAMALERQIKKTKSRKSIARYIQDSRNVISDPIPLRDIVSGGMNV